MIFRSRIQNTVFLIEFSLLLAIFSIYACGNSVLWVLLSIEREDIEYYYFEYGENGEAYVNALLNEAEQSSTKNTPSAIHSFDWVSKIYTAHQRFDHKIIHSTERKAFFTIYSERNLQEGFETIIFHPPTNSMI